MAGRDIKMIGLDLDGTLLTSKKEFTSYTKNILKKAIDRGVIILPATGRPYSGVPSEIMEFPGIRYALTANGARVIDAGEDRILYENLVDFETAGRLLEIFKHYDALLEIYYDGVGYARAYELNNIHEYLPEAPMADYIVSTRRPVEDVHEMFWRMKRPTDKVQAIFADIRDKEKALEQIAEEVPNVEVTGALSNNIEVNAKDVNKGKALIELGKLLGIRREEIMACGDGANDIFMMQEAGFGVAMGNAIDEVKEAADCVTCSNDENGVAKAIEEYVLKYEKRR